jgi:xanthine dehydrogenase YagS FAD-binding subunit
VALDISDGLISAVRIALGGVATKPWRCAEAESTLVGQAASESAFQHAADVALQEARPRRDNAFKVELAKRTVVAAFRELMDRSGTA